MTTSNLTRNANHDFACTHIRKGLQQYSPDDFILAPNGVLYYLSFWITSWTSPIIESEIRMVILTVVQSFFTCLMILISLPISYYIRQALTLAQVGPKRNSLESLRFHSGLLFGSIQTSSNSKFILYLPYTQLVPALFDSKLRVSINIDRHMNMNMIITK